MRVLAQRFDERVRRNVSRFDQLVEPAQERGSVLREPASESDIARAEERLGVRLPSSYRLFLLVSDGAYASALGAEVVKEHDLRHGLLSVNELQRTVDGDEVGVRVFCGDLAEPYDRRTTARPRRERRNTSATTGRTATGCSSPIPSTAATGSRWFPDRAYRNGSCGTFTGRERRRIRRSRTFWTGT